MITYEKFKKIIVKYICFAKNERNLYNAGIDIVNSDLFEVPGYFMDWLWEAYFIDAGVDAINWFMFEHHDLVDDFDKDGESTIDEEEYGLFDENDKPIPMKTIEDLWECVKDYRREFVKTLGEQLQEQITAQLAAALTPITEEELINMIGEDWVNFKPFFNDTERLVYVEAVDGLDDILETRFKDTAPYLDNTNEVRHLQLYFTSVGAVIHYQTPDKNYYIWQG